MDGNAILAGFAVSTVGLGFFLYGKKQARVPQMVYGLICLVYPYFVGGPFVVLGLFAALSLAFWLALRFGL